MTDGNTYAINKNLDDALLKIRAEVEQAEARIEELEGLEEMLMSATMDGYDMVKNEYRKYIDELEAKLEELLVVSKRAVRLSLDHPEFKLYAMEPMRQAIAAAERLTKRTGG